MNCPPELDAAQGVNMLQQPVQSGRGEIAVEKETSGVVHSPMLHFQVAVGVKERELAIRRSAVYGLKVGAVGHCNQSRAACLSEGLEDKVITTQQTVRQIAQRQRHEACCQQC